MTVDRLGQLRSRAAGCTACELHALATQTVFGDGAVGAALMLVGEQPGDREDVRGEPFAGPAGGVLDRALDRAGVAHSDAYVTNVVKHFRFRQQGKRRIHQTPGVEHVRACLPWLHEELTVVGPALLVTLGATAAKSLLGSSFRLSRNRGEFQSYGGRPVLATVHPSAVLRGPQEQRGEVLDGLAADLALAGRTAAGARAG